VDFEAAVLLALAEVRLTRKEGNLGYGAVILLGEQGIGKAYDTALPLRDSNLHTGDADLRGSVLASTCEPCPLCSSNAVWSNRSG
jgi:tRNA(Arg) A34 adenosine deaminase TadA